MLGRLVVDAPVGVTDLGSLIASALETHQWCLRNEKKYTVGANLSGMCARASFHLLETLRKAKVVGAGILACDEHMVVLVNEHILIDPTIAQFDSSVAVFVGIQGSSQLPLKYPSMDEFFVCEHQALRWMEEVGWYPSQVPDLLEKF